MVVVVGFFVVGVDDLEVDVGVVGVLGECDV